MSQRAGNEEAKEGSEEWTASELCQKREERIWNVVGPSNVTMSTGETSICLQTERKGLIGRLEIWSDGESGDRAVS